MDLLFTIYPIQTYIQNIREVDVHDECKNKFLINNDRMNGLIRMAAYQMKGKGTPSWGKKIYHEIISVLY